LIDVWLEQLVIMPDKLLRTWLDGLIGFDQKLWLERIMSKYVLRFGNILALHRSNEAVQREQVQGAWGEFLGQLMAMQSIYLQKLTEMDDSALKLWLEELMSMHENLFLQSFCLELSARQIWLEKLTNMHEDVFIQVGRLSESYQRAWFDELSAARGRAEIAAGAAVTDGDHLVRKSEQAAAS